MSDNVEIIPKNLNLQGTISLSGSKSISNRVLIIKALCHEDFHIENLSNSNDTTTLQNLLASDELKLNTGHAGTTFRFLTAYLSVTNRETILSGSERMHQRPIGELVTALRSIGAKIDYMEKEGFPPLHIYPSDIINDEVELTADISSQFITALLLIAPSLPNGLKVKLTSEPVSRPYIEMTLRIMEFFGIRYDWDGRLIDIPAQKYVAKDFFVESDWSSASYLYAAAAISNNSEITINGLTDQKIQGDSEIANIMTHFGVETKFSNRKITISKSETARTPTFIEYDFISQPDIAQTVCVVAAAKGTSLLMSGLQTLKIKETDRVAALKVELAKFGVSLMALPPRFSAKTEIEYYMQEGKISTDDKIEIDTYNDHRMAMAFAPLGMLLPLIIRDKNVVNKSYPNFWSDLSDIGFSIS